MSDATITTGTDLAVVLGRITFAPSGVMLHRMDLRWEVEDMIRRNRRYYGSTTGEPFPGIEKVTIEPLVSGSIPACALRRCVPSMMARSSRT